MLTEIVALSALAAALSGVLMYWKDRKAVYSLVGSIKELANNPEKAGIMLRAWLPPPDVAGVINAVVESQKPSVMHFIEAEGLPLLATIGGGQVASDARLAKAAKGLGGGASGLQGLMGLITAPSKKSGMGDLLAYLPLIREFMSNQQPSNGGGALPPAPRQGPGQAGVIDWSSYR